MAGSSGKIRILRAAPLALAALIGLSACEVVMPSSWRWPDHWDPWPRPRGHETPREATLRQCRTLGERFHVDCKYCHTTDKPEAIAPPNLLLTDVGKRAEVMRRSGTYGLGQDCGRCHLTGFKLNRNGKELFVGNESKPGLGIPPPPGTPEK